jgi:hypothetical protein
MLMMFCLVLARIVSETGLVFVQFFGASVWRPWAYASQDLPAALATRTTLTNFYFGSWLQSLLVHDMREGLPPYAIHALRVADGAAFGDADPVAGNRSDAPRWRGAFAFTVALLVALAAGYLIAGYATLRTEYTYAATLDTAQESPINGYGVSSTPRHMIIEPTVQFRDRGGPTDGHNRFVHFGLGAGATGLLAALRLRYVGWPLHPVGMLMVYSYPMQRIWLSLFAGWLLKALIVRLGGSSLYRSSRPVFIGLVIGEAGASAFWLVVSLVRVSMGLDYRALNLLPT